MKRDIHHSVYHTRTEENDALAKLEQLGMKKMAELFRYAVEQLDVNLADENIKLKERVEEIANANSDIHNQWNAATAQAEVFEKNAKYWENYGNTLIADKEKLQLEIKNLTVENTSLTGKIELYEVDIDANKSMIDNFLRKCTKYPTRSFAQATEDVVQLQADYAKNIDELEGEVAELKKELSESYQGCDDQIDNQNKEFVKKEDAFKEDLKLLVLNLGLDLKTQIIQSFNKKEHELSVGDLLSIVRSGIIKNNTHLKHAQQACAEKREDLAKKEDEMKSYLETHHQLVWQYNQEPLRKIWWGCVKRYFAKFKKPKTDAVPPTAKGDN